MLIYRSRFLIRGEVWFEDEPGDAPVDWIYYRQRSRPIAGSRWRYFHTRLIDLAKSPGRLLAEMDDKTVGKIKEAEGKDKTRWERCDPGDAKVMDDIERLWNQFAAARESARLDRQWLEKLIEADALELSVTRDREGAVLTYHLGYAGRTRGQDLIVVSRYDSTRNSALRNLVNRANCLGHWRTLLTLKERGLRHYDFGGWYTGTTDMRLLGMNAFKKGFGGKVVREYDCEQVRTLKGWIGFTVVRILDRTADLRISRASKSRKPARATARDYQVSPAF